MVSVVFVVSVLYNDFVTSVIFMIYNIYFYKFENKVNYNGYWRHTARRRPERFEKKS